MQTEYQRLAAAAPPFTPRAAFRPPSLLAACLLLLSISVLSAAQDYEVPQPVIQAFRPKGLKVSIPDSDGVQLFAFHGNVNRPLSQPLEAGDMSADVTRRSGGAWTYHNKQQRLKVGDVLYFWLYVIRDGRGYRLDDQTYQITELLDTPGDDVVPPINRQPEQRPTALSPGSGNEYVAPSSEYGGTVYRPPPTDGYRPPPPDVYRPPPSDGYRPPPDGHRPPPSDGYRPPPDGHRPPPDGHRPAPDGHRPPPDGHRPPPDGNRPPPSDGYRPSPEGHRPLPSEGHRPQPDGNRPTPSDGYRPPPAVHRPLPDEYRPPPHYGSRPPPSHNHNHEYPPPPPPGSGQTSTVIHNHHVGFANNNNNRPPYGSENVVSRPTDSSGAAYGEVGGSEVDRQPTFSGAEMSQGLGSSWGGQQQATAAPPLTGDRFTVSPPLTPADCELSATTVNGRQACKGEVVFEENWRTLNLRRWEYEVKISGHPDYEFCIYAQHPENTYVEGGMLHLKPTLTNDKYGADFIRRGKLTLDDCTAGPVNSDSCSREAMFSYILPPVVASRLNTKSSFSFKYGKIEVQAKLPRGDWIYPELWLQPLREEYGPGLSSGRLHLAMARGNRNLRGPPPESEDLSGQLLVVGALAGGKGVGSGGARRKFFSKRKDRGYWADNFHNYTLLWTPETLAFSVDGVELGVARPEELGGLLHGRANEDDPWSSGSRMAPFDKEFYVSLGLAVGGIHAFPDGCRSSSHEKPWKNTGAKAMLSFWNDKDHWFPTWTDQQSEMVVRSVRVTALNN